MPEREPFFKREKIGEIEGLERIRRSLETTLLALERSGETEKKGELPAEKFRLFGRIPERIFWMMIPFPRYRKDFWKAEREYAKTPLPKNTIEQNFFCNSTPAPLRGRIFDGFKGIPVPMVKRKYLNVEGIPPFEKRKFEIIVVDRKKDKELAKLYQWARGLREIQDEEEKAFLIAQLVHNRMGGYSGIKINEEVKKIRKERKEILLGDIEYGVCPHQSLLFQVLAAEAEIESFWKRGVVKKETGTWMIHFYNPVFLKTGEILIADAMFPPFQWGEYGFGDYFGEVNYKEFKKEGGFPRFGSNRLPFGVYIDEMGRFQGGRLGVDGLRELLKKE